MVNPVLLWQKQRKNQDLSQKKPIISQYGCEIGKVEDVFQFPGQTEDRSNEEGGIRMDYTGYIDFPFPSRLSEDGERAKAYFFGLGDEEQLRLLSGMHSYEEFQGRILREIDQRKL